MQQLELFTISQNALWAYCPEECFAVRQDEYWQEELAVSIPVQTDFVVVGENDLPAGTRKVIPNREFWTRFERTTSGLIRVPVIKKRAVNDIRYWQEIDF